ncbi:hypothetical protein C8R45DRAFT_365311 [Mycena sanguinolenta]|nr:hypothetical protein C8R45DRAFT_365311 [Mycena sanguinolenta]
MSGSWRVWISVGHGVGRTPRRRSPLSSSSDASGCTHGTAGEGWCPRSDLGTALLDLGLAALGLGWVEGPHRGRKEEEEERRSIGYIPTHGIFKPGTLLPVLTTRCARSYRALPTPQAPRPRHRRRIVSTVPGPFLLALHLPQDMSFRQPSSFAWISNTTSISTASPSAHFKPWGRLNPCTRGVPRRRRHPHPRPDLPAPSPAKDTGSAVLMWT